MEAPSATEWACTDPLDSIEAENRSQLAAAEAVAQAGAGALLVAVGVAELLLGVWAAGWWQRSAAVFLASVGLVAVAWAIVPVFAREPESSGRPIKRTRESLVGPIARRNGAWAL